MSSARLISQSLPGRRRERAIALPLAVIVVVLVMIAGIALLEVGKIDCVQSAGELSISQARAAAEIGIHRARAMASSQCRRWSEMTKNNAPIVFGQSGDPLYEGHMVATLFDQEAAPNVPAYYSVVIEDLGGDIWTSFQFRIHSFGTCNGKTEHVTLNSQALSFASFGWFSANAAGVYWSTNDWIDGWLHTNDQLKVWGGPVFAGRVSSSEETVFYAHPEGGPPVFQQGLYLNAPEIDMSLVLNAGHIAAIRNSALAANGVYPKTNVKKPYTLTFFNDGTFSITQEGNGSSGVNTIYDHAPISQTNGAFYFEEPVYVSGTVNGEVSIATPDKTDITVTSDLVYAWPPNPATVFQPGFNNSNPLITDKIGLISGGSIQVKKDWAAGNDLYLMGSYASVTGGVDIDHQGSADLDAVHVFGSTAQFKRGPVGPTPGESLYRKDFHYDPRFMNGPPPHFPVVSYDYQLWRLNP